MQILLISATTFEIKKIIDDLHFDVINDSFYSKKIGDNSVDILISGIGIAFTVYSLTKALNRKKYDFVLNVGIVGAFADWLKIGDVVQVTSEEFGDLGIRSKNSFSSLFDTGFIKPNEFPFTDGKLINKNNAVLLLFDTESVVGLTVNSVNGNKNEIEEIKRKFKADIESMEGAAVFYVCLMENVAFVQIRSVSNYVEERNKANWDIPLAIDNLTKYCKDLLNKI
ncbi:MAG: futalosine hydrolase [Bacteroidetes bacterium 4572_117]|nr:MAG: futalosine hydrolase [Bacteroidetes bacterium 4572_117]